MAHRAASIRSRRRGMGSWALIEEEAEIAADENEEYIYDDDGTLTHNTKYRTGLSMLVMTATG